VRQARRLREDQARPFVIVDFEPGFLVYLTVENIGKTMARDVTITFDKKLESSLKGRQEIDDSPLFREPIPALPPGKKIRVLLDSFENRLIAKLPLAYEVTIKYRGTSRNARFNDLYKLDLGMYLGSALPDNGLPELVTVMKVVPKTDLPSEESLTLADFCGERSAQALRRVISDHAGQSKLRIGRSAPA
jgi:hypothetical protein